MPAGSATVLYADHIDAHGTESFRAVCEQDLEGIVAERRDGLYTPEKAAWTKIKIPTAKWTSGVSCLRGGGRWWPRR